MYGQVFYRGLDRRDMQEAFLCASLRGDGMAMAKENREEIRKEQQKHTHHSVAPQAAT